MNIIELFQSEYISILAGGLAGIITAWLTQRVLNKRGVFSYNVHHNRIGLSANDDIFGNVAVTLNGNQVPNLYLSTVRLVNESLNDYENVTIRIYTSDTKLMTEQTRIEDSPYILEHSQKYSEQIHVENDQQPTPNQWAIYNGQREYMIPIFNRGQSVTITYLNSANSNDDHPHLWLAANKKGVKVKFKQPQNEAFGVQQNIAALTGLFIGLVIVVILLSISNNVWFIAFVSFFLGLIAQVPGAFTIKAIRRLREIIGG